MRISDWSSDVCSSDLSNLSFSKFGQATELKNRIWFTIGALIVFRFLSFVPLPGVDPVALSQLYNQAASGGVLDIFNTFSGGSLERMSIIALGVKIGRASCRERVCQSV